ncbi:Rpn family recombination-promoting nuclease/putative transposase, partial [Synechococcus sp. CS-1328]|uniref:Rpn family recombination-promoting nuclease/putative transposase n=1 Tax=Synechococcus sp. CS-1328 TaxID=2847976 RepID=UPI00223A6DB2
RGADTASGSSTSDLGLDPSAPGDRLYRFSALEIKELSHRLDGVLWPREATGCAETGSAEFPVVLLEVQMQTACSPCRCGPWANWQPAAVRSWPAVRT